LLLAIAGVLAVGGAVRLILRSRTWILWAVAIVALGTTFYLAAQAIPRRSPGCGSVAFPGRDYGKPFGWPKYGQGENGCFDSLNTRARTVVFPAEMVSVSLAVLGAGVDIAVAVRARQQKDGGAFSSVSS
jgi:hypothetical protein